VIRAAWLGAAGALLLACSPIAFAADPCVTVPGASELTIEQLGRVIFSELSTDRARDLVTFEGGVCLELGDVEVRVEAETMVVHAPLGQATLEAVGAVVHAAEWRLSARRLEMDRATVQLWEVTLEGSGIVGRARSMHLDLEQVDMTAHELEVVTPTVRLVARSGTFSGGERLVVDEVVVSTCDCPPREAAMRIEGGVARLSLLDEVLVVERGILVIEPLRLALPAVLSVSEASLASLQIPLSLGIVPEGARGWVLGLVERRDGDTSARADVAFGRAADPRWSASLSASEGGATVSLSARDGAVAIAAAQRVPLVPGVAIVLSQRNEGGAVIGRLQDSAATIEWGGSWPPDGPGRPALEARAELTGALSAQASSAGEVAHGRARAAASLTATTSAGPAGTFAVRLEGGATRYSGDVASQAWFGVAPRWRASLGPLSLDLHHTWRHVVGTSPFDERIDRVPVLSLTSVQAAWEMGVDWRLAAALDLRYDWRPAPERAPGRVGIERLRVTVDVAGPHLGRLGLAWEGAVTLEAAGALDPHPDRDAFLAASLGVATPLRAHELSVAGEFGIGPLRPGVRSLTLAGAAPIVFADGDVLVQPYLALDVWPTLAGAGFPRLAGHGLAVRWTTCCGVLDVGYRSRPDGSFTTRLGFSLVTREPDLEDLGW
jgi:hypothetical protein